VLYKVGMGVEQDDSEAAKWTMRAAEHGMLEAMNNLGTMYEFGHGVERNGLKALEWTRKAAEGGYLTAQVHLATLYFSGICTNSDVPEGAKWLQMAAVCGDAEGQFQLGLLHETGAAPNASDVEAVKWYTAAGDQGHTEALFKLGCMYIQGKGLSNSDGVEKKTVGTANNNWLVLSSNNMSEENRVANALACFVLAGSRGHELSMQLVEELRPKLQGGEPVPLPQFTPDSDPAAVVAAIASAAAKAANHSMDLGEFDSPKLSPVTNESSSGKNNTKKNKGKKK
jgi:TPR repeat protein